jgi:protein-S-isoprenylcysteine O-methyltransferase Ste14
MATSRFFDWFQFGILVCWGTLGVTRALLFHARGVRVIVADRQRTFWERLADGLALACLLVWAYEVVAYAWSFGFHVGPTSFGRILVDSIAIKVVGAVVVSTAVLLYAIALRHLGASWRLGIDRAAPGPLVIDGIYRWTRHPIYVAFDLLFVGAFLVHGRLIFLCFALVWIPLQHVFMQREERFLTQLYGGAYRDYCGSVGRYFSWHR